MTTTTAAVLVVVVLATCVALVVLVAHVARSARELVDRTGAVRERVAPLLADVSRGAERAGAHAGRVGRGAPGRDGPASG